MTKDEALKKARELVQRFVDCDGISSSDYLDVRDAIDKALAQPEQEPVAWPCVIETADFEEDTITLKMKCSDYKVATGQHWLSTHPPVPTAQPEQEPTYTNTQATNCAGCGEHKHTPLRIDAMGGYVCLTCIDKKLGSLLGEFGYEQPEQEPVAWAWDEGYRQGVKDERTSEANIGIAGFGAKVEPARQNPYGATPPQRKPLTDEQIDEIWRTHLHRDSRVRAVEAAHGIKE